MLLGLLCCVAWAVMLCWAVVLCCLDCCVVLLGLLYCVAWTVVLCCLGCCVVLLWLLCCIAWAVVLLGLPVQTMANFDCYTIIYRIS